MLCEPKLIHEEPYPSRDLPVVLERISTLHLESKCAHFLELFAEAILRKQSSSDFLEGLSC